MFIVLFLVLMVAWVLGFAVMHTAGFMIHLLLLGAIISIVLHFFTSSNQASA